MAVLQLVAYLVSVYNPAQSGRNGQKCCTFESPLPHRGADTIAVLTPFGMISRNSGNSRRNSGNSRRKSKLMARAEHQPGRQSTLRRFIARAPHARG